MCMGIKEEWKLEDVLRLEIMEMDPSRLKWVRRGFIYFFSSSNVLNLDIFSRDT